MHDLNIIQRIPKILLLVSCQTKNPKIYTQDKSALHEYAQQSVMPDGTFEMEIKAI